MILLLEEGRFRLAETKHGTKLLTLNGTTYAWLMVPGIGSLLVFSTRSHGIADILSEGRFRIYGVEDEPDLSDQMHLEVEIAQDAWQGYLLLTGLPTVQDSRKVMVPTHELISSATALPKRIRRRKVQPVEPPHEPVI